GTVDLGDGGDRSHLLDPRLHCGARTAIGSQPSDRRLVGRRFRSAAHTNARRSAATPGHVRRYTRGTDAWGAVPDPLCDLHVALQHPGATGDLSAATLER